MLELAIFQPANRNDRTEMMREKCKAKKHCIFYRFNKTKNMKSDQQRQSLQYLMTNLNDNLNNI